MRFPSSFQAALFLVVLFVAPMAHGHDIDGDSKIGLAEAISALRIAAGIVTENTPTTCTDGLDNDGDGFTDCDDYDCIGITGCVQENTPATCTDGLDNDGDGFTDCNDYDCIGISGCSP
jgi:hypothetical protein